MREGGIEPAGDAARLREELRAFRLAATELCDPAPLALDAFAHAHDALAPLRPELALLELSPFGTLEDGLAARDRGRAASRPGAELAPGAPSRVPGWKPGPRPPWDSGPQRRDDHPLALEGDLAAPAGAEERPRGDAAVSGAAGKSGQAPDDPGPAERGAEPRRRAGERAVATAPDLPEADREFPGDPLELLDRLTEAALSSAQTMAEAPAPRAGGRSEDTSAYWAASGRARVPGRAPGPMGPAAASGERARGSDGGSAPAAGDAARGPGGGAAPTARPTARRSRAGTTAAGALRPSPTAETRDGVPVGPVSPAPSASVGDPAPTPARGGAPVGRGTGHEGSPEPLAAPGLRLLDALAEPLLRAPSGARPPVGRQAGSTGTGGDAAAEQPGPRPASRPAEGSSVDAGPGSVFAGPPGRPEPNEAHVLPGRAGLGATATDGAPSVADRRPHATGALGASPPPGDLRPAPPDPRSSVPVATAPGAVPSATARDAADSAALRAARAQVLLPSGARLAELDAGRLASLVNDALVEQARRHGVDLS